MRISTVAPAKINWSLEVLGRRPDGYHEIRTVFQTISLCDRLRVAPTDGLELILTGPAAGPAAQLADVPPSENLAYRAAALLRDAAGRRGLGARIELKKVIPTGAGLGGGSSDAAATLRALDRLWGLGLPQAELAQVAARLGADVPFFLFGGTALGRGRGDEVTPLSDVPAQRLLLVVPKSGPGHLATGKTASMYAGLRPKHFSSGEATERLVAALGAGTAPREEEMRNIFEAVVADVLPAAVPAARYCRWLGLRPHLAGSGPAQFALLAADGESAPSETPAAGLDVFEAATLGAVAATALVEEA